MPDALLTILKFCLLGLIYLFFFRVIRAVWAELRAPAVPPLAPPPAGAAAPMPAAARPARPAKPAPRAAGPVTQLRMTAPPEKAGSVFTIDEEMTIGRAAGCSIAIEDTYVSSLHARVFRRDGAVHVEDLGSTNGTFVNGRKVSAPVALRPGDKVKVGGTTLEAG